MSRQTPIRSQTPIAVLDTASPAPAAATQLWGQFLIFTVLWIGAWVAASALLPFNDVLVAAAGGVVLAAAITFARQLYGFISQLEAEQLERERLELSRLGLSSAPRDETPGRACDARPPRRPSATRVGFRPSRTRIAAARRDADVPAGASIDIDMDNINDMDETAHDLDDDLLDEPTARLPDLQLTIMRIVDPVVEPRRARRAHARRPEMLRDGDRFELLPAPQLRVAFAHTMLADGRLE